MDKKTILAIVLSLAVLYLYQAFFVKPLPQTKPAAVQPQTATTIPETAGKVSPKAVLPQGQAKEASALSVQQKKGLADVEVPVETEEFSAVFSTRGAALRSYKLKKFRNAVEKNSPLIELIKVNAGTPEPLTVSFAGSDFSVPDNALYEVQTETKDVQNAAVTRKLTFILEYPDLVKVERIYRFYQGKYSFDLEIRVTNLTGSALSQLHSINWYEYADPQAPVDEYGHDGPVSQVAKNIEREDVKKLAAAKTLGPDVSWGGYESKYFIAAMIPQTPSLTTLALEKSAEHTVHLSMKAPKNVIPPGQTTTSGYLLYLGPKDHSLLKAYNVGLENAIDFGSWLKWLAMPLLLVLKFIYNILPNYGIGIIILTTLIKIIFWPLGNKSYRSMKEMQNLQPKMADLREKYKDDKTRLSQEMMALYKTHKVNPMGGCLPMVIQIPFFFALYKTLLYSIELRHSPFFWWIQDLSAKDPYYITPIIMGGTMFLQQKMTPPAGDPMQAKIMLFMPVIFTVMFLNFPSGLVIYWLFNNIISIGQQHYINKSLS